jgi:carbonic anhydrase/acetyltransferase-like protein (isoleucine patch superfamily)
VAPDGHVLEAHEWRADGVVVGEGAAVGASSVVVAGVQIGRWALVAAGAVVTADVPDHALVVGTPARQIGWVGHRGHRLVEDGSMWRCPVSGELYREGADGLEPVGPSPAG